MSDSAPTASEAAVGCLRLSAARGVGPILFGRLMERYGSVTAVLQASGTGLREVDGIGHTTADEILRAGRGNEYEKELKAAAAQGVRILCREDEDYPRSLRHIPDAPLCLYVKGRLEPADAVAVAIVGSRRCSHYGREQARRFGYALAERGVTVVSGLARGIDAEAHRGAIEAGGRTIAVLGNGLANIYPPEHKELADRIVAGHGALLSELPMQTPPEAENFVPRNRIIAGLSLGAVIVEAAQRSGALSTSRYAAEYDREVFAIPGRIDSATSLGTNELIRDQHAKLVLSAKDVLDELGEAGRILCEAEPHQRDVNPSPNLTAVEKQLFDSLDSQERSIDQLAADTGLAAAQIASTLISMQLKGLVRQLPGGIFARNNAGR